jgi:deazaflavin-dependent oxidoreductase (nitroreductase family)
VYYHRPAKLTEWMNRGFSWLAGLGLTPSDTVTLEVKGRKSGQTRANVVTSVTVDGVTYLVSPRGNSEWTRNVRAAGGDATIRRRGRKRVRLVEVPVEQRAPIIKAYLAKTWRATQQHVEVDRNAPVEEFARIADRHPVFRVIVAEG